MDIPETRRSSQRRASIEASSAILAMNLQMKISGNGSHLSMTGKTPNAKLQNIRPSRKRQSVSLYDASPKQKKPSKSMEAFNANSPSTSTQIGPKCTCYDPPVCPLHNLSPQPLISPFITFQNSQFSCTSHLSMAMQCGSSQSSTATVSVPAIFQGHLLIPQHFANSLEKTIAAQQHTSTDCITIKEPCLEIKSVPQSECSLQKEPCLDYDPTEHPEEPHPPINSTEVKHETKISKLVSSPCAQSSNWLPIGKPLKRWVYFNNDEKPLRRQCYNAIKHKTETDSIQLRDCVIVNSENSRNVFVGKIAEFFEDPKSKTLWASLMWFYWPDQTELDKQHNLWHSKEIFASRHLDIVPVDSIQDVAYVLTFNEYNRYKAENLYEQLWPPRHAMVPRATGSYYRRRLMPTEDTEESNVFFCRNVYDFHKKRLNSDTN